jgi:hypothetical protein
MLPPTVLAPKFQPATRLALIEGRPGLPRPESSPTSMAALPVKVAPPEASMAKSPCSELPASTALKLMTPRAVQR